MQAPTTDQPNVARVSSAHILDVTSTALSNQVRLQVWDGLAPENDARAADVRLTLAQTRRLIAELTIAADQVLLRASDRI